MGEGESGRKREGRRDGKGERVRERGKRWGYGRERERWER